MAQSVGRRSPSASHMPAPHRLSDAAINASRGVVGFMASQATDYRTRSWYADTMQGEWSHRLGANLVGMPGNTEWDWCDEEGQARLRYTDPVTGQTILIMPMVGRHNGSSISVSAKRTVTVERLVLNNSILSGSDGQNQRLFSLEEKAAHEVLAYALVLEHDARSSSVAVHFCLPTLSRVAQSSISRLEYAVQDYVLLAHFSLEQDAVDEVVPFDAEPEIAEINEGIG